MTQPRVRNNSRRRLILWSGVSALCWASAALAANPLPAQDLQNGERLYREGLLSSGEPLAGTVSGDVVIRGRHIACVNCHRRSGFGESEGATIAAPITGPILFQPRVPRRADLFRSLYQEYQPAATAAQVRSGRLRPAYTAELVAAAIRDGIDPSGRVLDAAMPRYKLAERDMASLVAYLKTLSAAPPPGVADTVVHFATVVGPEVSASMSTAMTDVLRSFVANENLNTQRYLDRPGISPHYKNEFYSSWRKWKLHIWELHGPPESWDKQLEHLYEQQPVFAMISGIVEGPWKPIHDFCERVEMPCLFPHTRFPVVDGKNDFSLYLSKGLAVEGQVVAQQIAPDAAESARPIRVLQVYRDRPAEHVLAEALRAALRSDERAEVEDCMLSDAQHLTQKQWAKLFTQQLTAAVLWLDENDLATWADAGPASRSSELPVFVSSSLLKKPDDTLAAQVTGPMFVTRPFEMPGREVPRIYRVRAWLRSRGIESPHERILLNTYFAASFAKNALVHMVDNFSRDYLIESIEHETENALNPGVYPRLSLGPGQRFASRGCYVTRVPPGASSGSSVEPRWIISE